MGAQTRQVGGGNATGVANEFNNFLMQQLTGGNVTNQRQQNFANSLAGGPGPFGAVGRQLQGQIAQQNSNSQQPGQQTSAFQNAFQNAMSGQVGDQSGANAALQNFFQNPGANNLNLPQFQNQFTAPQYQQAQTTALPTNFGAGQTGMADISGFGNAAQSNFGINPLNSQFTGQLQGLMGAGMNALNNFSNGGGFAAASAGPDVQMERGMDYGQAYNTLGQDPLMERQRQRAVADMRARFGAEGAGALGTGAQTAEGNLNAELSAQDASMRRNQAMALMGQDLANRSALAQSGLQNRGQNMQTSIANMQGGLQGAQNQISGFNAQNNALGQMLGAAGQARGQDLSTGLGQQQLGAQQSMFNAGQSNDLQTAMLNAALQNQGLGNQFGLGAAGLNNQAMQTNNANNINQSQFQNQFNQNNSQLGAQFGQANNALNSQNMTNQAQINNQMLQNMIGQGLNLNQLGNANTIQMLQNLFGGFQQSNQLGTPQAQMVQQPSGWGQALNAGLSLGGALLGGPAGAGIGSALGGLFGGGRGLPGGFNPQIGLTPGFGGPSQAGGIGMPTMAPRPGSMPVLGSFPTLSMGF